MLSPQVKRCAIITYKHGIYELPHGLLVLPQDLKKLRKVRKVSKPHRKNFLTHLFTTLTIATAVKYPLGIKKKNQKPQVITPSHKTLAIREASPTPPSMHRGIISTLSLSIFFLPVIYWCSYKGIFRILFPKFLQRRFCSMHQSVFAILILNALLKLSIVLLCQSFFKKSLKSLTLPISQISFKLFPLFCVAFKTFFKNKYWNNFNTPALLVLL